MSLSPYCIRRLRETLECFESELSCSQVSYLDQGGSVEVLHEALISLIIRQRFEQSLVCTRERERERERERARDDAIGSLGHCVEEQEEQETRSSIRLVTSIRERSLRICSAS